MKYVVSRAQMREIDRYTIEKLGIPSLTLMENAGIACANYLIDSVLPKYGNKILILCGTGNNGGDGAVIASILDKEGYQVTILLVGSAKQSPENIQNLIRCKEQGILLTSISSLNDLSELPSGYDVIVDAIYGTGFRGNPDALHSQLFDLVNAYPAYKVAIDISSGLDADGIPPCKAIRADLSLAIGAIKPAHYSFHGRDYSGQTVVLDIGFPAEAFADRILALQMEKDDIRFPYRNKLAHKGSYGSVIVIGGSPGMAGSVLLCSKAALRAGAGYLRLYHHPSLAGGYETYCPELLSKPIPLDERANARLGFAELEKANAVVLGPGLGTDDYARRLVRDTLPKINCPLVLDADALRIVADDLSLLGHCPADNTVLTPHPREFALLCAKDTQDILADPFTHLRDFVAKHRISVLFKSSTTIFASPDGMKVINQGNDGLATGGSGDVLSGIIASFLAQGLPLEMASCAGAYLLGFTAEQLAKYRHTASILPSDVIEHLFEKNSEINFEEQLWKA